MSLLLTRHDAHPFMGMDVPWLLEQRALTRETWFDLASLTKVVFTTTALLELVDAGRIALDVAAAWRDQLWAEAVAAVDGGEAWHLGDEQERERVVHADVFRVRHPWEAVISDWLRNAWPNVRADRRAKGECARLTSAEVLRGALRLEPRDMDQSRQNKAAEVLRLLGFEPRKARLSRTEAAWWEQTTGKAQALVWEWFPRTGAASDTDEPEGVPDE